MKKALLTLDPLNQISQIDNRIYGSFLEHLGRAIYGGIYEPTHPLADEDGFRKDVIEEVRALNIPIIRYPGGNFVSGFNWEDSVGPRESRPSKLDLAWFSIESNEIGLHEFTQWLKKVNSDMMMAVNLGTRGPEEARNLVEYCNFPKGSYYSDLRRSHGALEPYGFKTWCLGNEMDGDWQICSKTAVEYGRIACETAKLMRWVDPDIELIACGSSSMSRPTFLDWESTVLDLCYDHIDYISLHGYFENTEADSPSFLAQNIKVDQSIRLITSVCDMVKRKKRSQKTINLAFDEWNVWYRKTNKDKENEKWLKAPHLLEDIYSFEDALLIGGVLISLIKNSDRVKIACLAQLVNVIAPIRVEENGEVWRQTIYYPFLHASKYGRGTATSVCVDSPKYDCALFSDVPYIDSVSVVDDATGEVTLFVLNRNIEEDMLIEVDLRGMGVSSVLEHIMLAGYDLKTTNTREQPNNVIPSTSTDYTYDNGLFTSVVKKASWNVFRFK